MPAISNLVVADATPTNKTLYPLSASIASSRFAERAANVIDGNRTVELKLSPATKDRPTDRITILYARPVEVLVDGAYVVNDIGRCSVEFVVPKSMTSTDRNHLWTEVKNLIALATVQSYVRDRDPCY